MLEKSLLSLTIIKVNRWLVDFHRLVSFRLYFLFLVTLSISLVVFYIFNFYFHFGMDGLCFPIVKNGSVHIFGHLLAITEKRLVLSIGGT